MSDAELVARLGQILATTTGLRLEDLDPEASFLELGLSSIALVDTFRAIRDTLGVRPSIRLVFEEYRTLGRLAGYIEGLLARRTEAEALQSPAALVDGATALPIPAALQHIWFLARYSDEASEAHQSAVGLRVDGALDRSRLERAWAELCDRHGALRARALPERDALFIDPAGSAAPIRVLTPTEAELLPAITRAATERLPLHQAAARLCLVEAGPRSHVLILVAHALVADRPSLERALVELLVLFENPRAGLPPALAFAEILRRLEARAEAPETAASLQHFRERFSPRPPPLDLPTDHRRPAVKAYAGARLVRPVPPEVAVGVAEVARRVGAPSSVVVLGALAELCRRLSGTRPVVIGVHGRLDELLPPGAEAIAPLSSPLPVLIPLERGAGVRSLLEAARSALTDALDHTGVPFLRLVEALDSGRDQSRSALYAVSFDAEGERPLPALAGLALERVQLPATRCRTDLAFRWVDAALGPELVVDYSSEIFERSTVLRWVKVLIQSLAALPTTLDRSAQAWSLAAQEPAPGALSGPEPDLPLERIEAALLERGAQPTVLGSSETWSATELWERSGELARRLVHLGLRRGDRVGLSLERTPSLVAAVLGVLRAGGAYVPLDPAYPPARLAMIVEDAGLFALITDHPAPWAPPGLTRLPPIAADEPYAQLPRLAATDAAYVLFTSGSTGRPKGVVIEHGNVAALLAWAGQCYSREELAYVLASTSLSFDLSVFELLAPLSVGGALVLAQDALELVEHPHRDRVTFLNTVPSAAQELVRLEALPASLRVVALAGEPLRGALVSAIWPRLPPTARLFNLYGPTECTVYATAAELTRDDRSEPSIGLPISGLLARVVDDEGAPVPRGAIGELVLAGRSVGRGYLGPPELSEARFGPDLLDPRLPAYRTGDRVRQRPDGGFDFFGRADHQVKLRGFRIELQEIEVALTRNVGATEAVVECQGEGTEAQLIAYVTGILGRTPSDVRTALGALLPEPFVPRHVVLLEALPRLPNGKIDRAALPRPEAPRVALRAEATLSTPTERALGEIWCQILGVPSVAPGDDFFLLGGHSLMMTALLVAMKERFGVRPKLRAMFDAATLRGLAHHVEVLRGEATALEAPEAGQLAARFARLEADAALPSDLRWATESVDGARPAEHIFLTGATGFVGVHVLAELLRTTSARVSCLVRGDPARVAAALGRFHLDEGLDLSRVRVVAGDVAAPGLGLSAEDYQRLARATDRVIHGAAEVNFVYPYDALRKTNVGGTAEVLRFAVTGRQKPLFFLSTSAVWPMGAHLSFGEDDDLHHGHRLNLGYDESKWVGERMVELARAQGLPVFVLRPGEVAGHSLTGQGVGEHFAMALVKGSLEIGAVPPFHGLVDLSPVDYVAAGIASLAGGPLPAARAFHLTNPWPMDARGMLEIMRQVGYRFEEPEFGEWKRRLFEHPSFAQNALYPYAPILEDFDPRNLQFPRYGCANARAALEPRGVRCHPLDDTLVLTYLRYYQSTGFLPPP